MGPKRALLFALTLGLPGLALGYSGVVDVTLSWGVGGTAISWSSSGQNALAVVGNASRLTQESGSNGTIYFNPDFATSSDYGPGPADDCLTLLSGYNTLQLRKYGCQQRDSSNANIPVFHPSAPADAGPAAAAVGTLNFTDTTLTGTLTVVATTDEPTGGDESSTGNGASGFNVRSQDGSPYGNAWYGVSTGATLTVDLTGNFSAAGWEIDGGTVRVSDPALQCQQGGIGGVAPDFVLCQISAVQGGLSADGSNLSFGVDVDGGAPGTTMAEVQIRDTAGTSIVASLSGVLASLAVSAGGSLSTDFGEYRAGAGTSTGGCQGQIRWDGSKITCGTLTAGTLQITGTATPVDTEPDPFVFTDVTAVALGSLVTSDPVTITGIAAPARITVTGGQYSIGCTGTFTTAAGNIPDGSTVCVRHTSSANPGTATVTTLNIGGITGAFTSTTVPADTTPDAFAFADRIDVAISTEIISAPVTITGINGAATVSVTGGEYAVSCSGTFTAAVGSVNPSQTVCVRHTSAAAPLTGTNTTLTVGGVSGTFTSTTAAGPADTTPDPFFFADQTGVALAVAVTSAPVTITGVTAAAPVSVSGGTYSVGCTAAYVSTPGSVSDSQTICVRHTSAGANNAQTNTTLTVGGVSDTFTSTTFAAIPPDTTPDPFFFADQTGVALAVTVTSAPVTITGVTAAAPVSVSGGTYSVGCTAAYVSTPGSVSNNQTICVRHTSAAANSAQTTTTLSVGGVTDTFTSTTSAAIPPDTTPDPFFLADQTGVALAVAVTSAPVTITGVTAATPVSVSGGTYSVGCTATYVSTPGSVSDSQTICVRHTSAAANNAQTNITLTVGGVSDTFTSTTAAGPADTTPDPFFLADQTGVALAVTVTSAPVTITGVTAATPVSVSGGTYSVGCTAVYVSTPSSVSNNEPICVRHTSAGANSAQTSTTLSVGGVTDSFTSTTVAAPVGGGGGGGGAPDPLLLAVLTGLPVWRRRARAMARARALR